MKAVLVLLLLSFITVTGAGCALMGPEDRDFYGKGWLKPSDLDNPTPHHAITDPSRPPQVAATGERRVAPEPEAQWLVPETESR